jgi:predicted nucleotidyltransferase
MQAIHVIMATSTSANPHNTPNEHIENIVRKRKLSSITFLGLFLSLIYIYLFYISVFGVLLIISGSMLASFENQRYSVSFIIFG